MTIPASKFPRELNTPCFVTQLIFPWCRSASWSYKTDNQQQGRTCTPKEQQFACYTSSLLISTSHQTARQTVNTPSTLPAFHPPASNLREETVLRLFLALMLLALHSAMGEGHSCSTSIWQVDPLTAGFPFPVCAALRMGWAKSSESWETLNAISRNNPASQKPQVPVFSPLWCLTMQWDAHIIWFCYSLGYMVSLLDVHYVWAKGRSEGTRNGWYQTQLLGAENPMSHSIAGFYLYSPGAVPL